MFANLVFTINQMNDIIYKTHVVTDFDLQLPKIIIEYLVCLHYQVVQVCTKYLKSQIPF